MFQAGGIQTTRASICLSYHALGPRTCTIWAIYWIDNENGKSRDFQPLHRALMIHLSREITALRSLKNELVRSRSLVYAHCSIAASNHMTWAIVDYHLIQNLQLQLEI